MARTETAATATAAPRCRACQDAAVVVRDDDYIERVLELVEQIPRGRVTTYGALADVVGGGPRLVGSVMAHHGGGVPWWRVIRADGSLPPSHQAGARVHYENERTPTLPNGRVDVRSAFWSPAEGGG